MATKEVLDTLFALSASGEYAQVHKIAESMLYENPEDPIALFYAANALVNTGHEETAYVLNKLAVKLRPDKAEIWQNMGHIADKIWRYDEALYCFSEALSRDPLSHEAYASMASAFVGLGQYELARIYALRALELCPESDMAKINLGFANLSMGNWREGWEGYEHLLGHPSKRRKIITYGPKPKWDGNPEDKLVVYTEQGIGDGIMFLSCIPDLLNEHNAPIIIDCDKKLEGLVKRSFPQCQVYGTRHDEAPVWLSQEKPDTSVAAGSLPMRYRETSDRFPGLPFLKADPTRKLMYRAWLDSLGTGKKVGISWLGGNQYGGVRKFEYDRLEALIKEFPGVHWVNLNYKASAVPDGIHTLPFATMTSDYDDTAALVDELDLVISVPQAVVHLAGALGKRCWCMCPDVTRWIYGTTGEKHPWYNSVRIFRGWATMLEQIKESLHADR